MIKYFRELWQTHPPYQPALFKFFDRYRYKGAGFLQQVQIENQANLNILVSNKNNSFAFFAKSFNINQII